MASKDVELVIRARDAASKTVQSIVAALDQLKASQAGVVTGARQTGGVLGQLTTEFANLEREVQGLQSLGRVVSQMDKAAAAVSRLEGSVERATAEHAKLSAAQQRASQSAQQAADAVERTKAALDAQKAAAQQVKEQTKGSGDAYLQQKAAVDQAKIAHTEAAAAKKLAASEERKLGAAVRAAADDLNAQKAALAAAQAEFGEITAVVGRARSALGGVEASQEAVSAAAKQAAADLDLVGQALERQRAAQAAPAASQTGAAAQATAAYRAQVAAVQAAGKAYDDARAQASLLGQQINGTVPPTREQARAFVLAKESAQQAKIAYLEAAAALNQLKGATRGGFAAFDKIAQDLRQTPAAVSGLGDAVRRTRNEIDRSNRRKGEVLFGLRPYELQNLSFQVNDLITQIASGTAPSQAFAQQFGQIIQLFPRMGAAILPIIPELVGLAIVLGTVGAAMAQVGDQEESVRVFSASLAASADGARHSAEEMAEAAHQLDVYGTSLKTAREELRIFAAAGIDDSMLERFGRTAENVFVVTGTKIPEAAKEMAGAFTRGFQAVDELDQKFNFLTAAEREHIKEMFESGRAAEARTEAFAIFERRMDDGANKARGPWTEAIRNLTQAWDNFLHFLGNTPVVQTMIELLGDLAQAARDVTAALPGAGGGRSAAAGGNPAIDREIRQLQELQAERDRVRRNGDLGARALNAASGFARRSLGFGLGNLLPADSGGARTVAQIDRQIAESQQRIAQLRRDQQNVVTEGSNAQQKAGQRVVSELQNQLDMLRGVNDERRIAIAGEKAYEQALQAGADAAKAAEARRLGEQIERTQVAKENAAEARSAASRARAASSRADALQNRLTSMEGQLLSAEVALERKVADGQLASLEDRMAVITADADKIKVQLERFRQQGGKEIGGESLADFERRLDTNTKILQQQETLKFYAESIGELEKQRDETLKGILDRYADGRITAAAAFNEIREANKTIGQDIAAVAGTAADFAASIRGAVVDPKLEAFIEKMQRLRDAPQTGTRTPTAAGGANLLANQERELNAIVSERNSIIETNNALLEQGVITLGEWRTRVQAAYAQTTPEIERQIGLIRQLLDLLLQQGAITQTVYDSWAAKLQAVQANTADLTTQIMTVNEANNFLADSGVQFFDRFLQRVAEGGNVVKAFGRAFLETTADMLLELGQLILKQQLLNLIMNSGAGAGLSGIVNGLANTGPLMAASTALAGAGATVAASAAPIMTAAAALEGAALTLMAANASGSMAGLFHSGGIAGSANRTRAVHPAIFAAARRYHVGGIAGLAPGEIPTILKRGEEVLTEDNPRHIFNASKVPDGGGGTTQPIRNVLVMDPAELEAAMSSPGGEKVVLSIIKRNAPTVASMLPGGKRS